MKNLSRLFLKIKTLILASAIVLIFLQIIFAHAIDDLTILIATALLIMGTYLNKLNEAVLIVMGLVLIAFCPFFLVFKEELTAEKLAIWAYIFLFLGVVKRIIIFLKKGRQNKEDV